MIGKGVHFLEAVPLGAFDMLVTGHVLYLAPIMDFEPAQDDAGSDMEGVSDPRVGPPQLGDQGLQVAPDISLEDPLPWRSESGPGLVEVAIQDKDLSDGWRQLPGIAAGGARDIDPALVQADMSHLQAAQFPTVEALVDHDVYVELYGNWSMRGYFPEDIRSSQVCGL